MSELVDEFVLGTNRIIFCGGSSPSTHRGSGYKDLSKNNLY